MCKPSRAGIRALGRGETTRNTQGIHRHPSYFPPKAFSHIVASFFVDGRSAQHCQRDTRITSIGVLQMLRTKSDLGICSCVSATAALQRQSRTKSVLPAGGKLMMRYRGEKIWKFAATTRNAEETPESREPRLCRRRRSWPMKLGANSGK